MKSLRFLWALLLPALFFACQKDAKNDQSSNENEVNASAKKPVPGNNCGNYSVSLNVDKLSEPGHTIFTWTITNPNPGNGSGTTLQDLSHWVFVPGVCLNQNWQDILSAWYNTGSGWTQIVP
ncbi:MAG TPA: hypothetical protein VHM26_05270, partial [Chitinophagaceae bacterium]|nr:hypothetical protein [Chitinophagaceae bacterium]